ncbi:MAG: alkaline phosphatase family protein [Pseudomonadota bacterium]
MSFDLVSMNTRFLIIVFDALRPEFVTPELMPNLTALAARGVTCANAHSTFPTETRVNQSAVTTGCYPHRHGIVANQFPLPEAAPGAVLNTGDDRALEAALAALDGPLLGVPTLGALLAHHGRRFATISAGTSGGGRLINIAAEQIGGFRLALRRTEAAVPVGVFDRIAQRIGPPPEYKLPGIDWNQYAMRAYLDWVEPEERPDVMLLWLSEPDESFHYHGIGSPEALSAIRAMDAALGEIMQHHGPALDAGEMQIIAMSDHGQITVAGEKLDLAARMRGAGFNAATSPADDPDYIVVVHTAGGIWVRDHDPVLAGQMTEWLLDQPWCGPLFTRGGLPGTLPIAEIMADHPRAPDIYLALDHADTPNAWEHAGTSADNSPYPTGGGCHGGLSRHELQTTLILAGSAFRKASVSDVPVGNVDILPTVLSVLGVALKHEIDGRVLTEALTTGSQVSAHTETLASGGPGQTLLTVSQISGTRYLDAAWRTSRKLD